jgi:hypothetical protein
MRRAILLLNKGAEVNDKKAYKTEELSHQRETLPF